MDKNAAEMYLRNVVSKAITGMNETTAADGGATLGVEIAKQIYGRMISNSSILTGATKVPMTKGLTIRVPYYNDFLSTSGTDVGVRAYFIDEGGDKTANIPSLGYADMSLGKLVVKILFTDELFQDRPDLADWFVINAADAIKNMLEYSMIWATGETVLGVCGDGLGSTVTTDFSATPSEAELVAAFKLLNPIALNGAKWYVAPNTFADLQAITYDVIEKDQGTMFILGKPVEICPWLNDTVHIMLANWAGYGVAYRDPVAKISDQIRFQYDESCFRMVMRVAGAPITASIDTGDDTQGWFVVPSVIS